MPYILQRAHGPEPLLVGERYWGDAREIDFSHISGCIALIEQVPSEMNAVRVIHLSLVTGDNTPVYDADSNVNAQIDGIMQTQGNFRACLGRIDFWRNSSAIQLGDFFSALMLRLGIQTQVQLPDAQLRVRWHQDTIQYSIGGTWIALPFV
jgi:hypothetical protein